MEEGRGIVCVTGGTGYVASWLIMRLLQHGYSVRATVRFNPAAESKRDISYLTTLPGASDRLQIFHADLNQPETFDEAIQGCTGVFHVAHPMDIDNKEPEETVTKRALEGTLGILKACLNSKTVKRVVYTSSLAAILFNSKGLSETDENTWSEIDICKSSGLVGSSYLVSKTLVEKTALEFAEKHGLDVVTVILPIVVGPFICPNIPSSVYMGMAPISGNQDLCKYLINTYMVHIDDVASAHIYLLEYPNAKGRYICSSVQTSIHELYEFLPPRYPELQIQIPNYLKEVKGYKRTKVSSKKLLNTGFEFKCGLGEMFDGAVQSYKEKGFL
ncbi:vestitone reductase-like [Pyrus ussuriensis x Pyrus communis]|uniref:Bifunctional dihydroflavonol 4-reductase/flavanone 4-reductase n=1 Tax=Pyrus ussuriensis x Pyrus communis TaxID=2448454 RepID=A0A5N5HKS0_9ROSA|nr:vestitone reductase-like [Pyrus ussuriensis x Pyrus communis]